MILSLLLFSQIWINSTAQASLRCSVVFRYFPQIKSEVIEQRFTSLEINRLSELAVRKYSIFDVLNIKKDLNSHNFIRKNLELPKAFIISYALKFSFLKTAFEVPRDVQPLKKYIHITELKSKFDLALNLIIKKTNELGYPWSTQYGRHYLSAYKNIPNIDWISLSEAKREILYNNNIILLVKNSETNETHQMHLSLDSFLYSPRTGRLVFSVLY